MYVHSSLVSYRSAWGNLEPCSDYLGALLRSPMSDSSHLGANIIRPRSVSFRSPGRKHTQIICVLSITTDIHIVRQSKLDLDLMSPMCALVRGCRCVFCGCQAVEGGQEKEKCQPRHCQLIRLSLRKQRLTKTHLHFKRTAITRQNISLFRGHPLLKP